MTAEIWIRSRHGTWRFFLVTPSALVEIDREEKRIESARDVSYTAGTLAEEFGTYFSGIGPDDLSHRERGSVLSRSPLFSSEKFRARKRPGCTSIASPPQEAEAMFPENTVISLE
jgi:hypothetical protein